MELLNKYYSLIKTFPEAVQITIFIVDGVIICVLLYLLFRFFVYVLNMI